MARRRPATASLQNWNGAKSSRTMIGLKDEEENFTNRQPLFLFSAEEFY